MLIRGCVFLVYIHFPDYRLWPLVVVVVHRGRQRILALPRKKTKNTHDRFGISAHSMSIWAAAVTFVRAGHMSKPGPE